MSTQSIIKKLTARELQVMKLVLDGKSNEQISIKLGIQLRTVEGFKSKLIAKTKTKSIIGLFRFALKNGLYVFKY